MRGEGAARGPGGPRKTLAVLLVFSLLATQQGVFVFEALAQVVSVPQTLSAPSGGGAVGAAARETQAPGLGQAGGTLSPSLAGALKPASHGLAPSAIARPAAGTEAMLRGGQSAAAVEGGPAAVLRARLPSAALGAGSAPAVSPSRRHRHAEGRAGGLHDRQPSAAAGAEKGPGRVEAAGRASPDAELAGGNSRLELSERAAGLPEAPEAVLGGIFDGSAEREARGLSAAAEAGAGLAGSVARGLAGAGAALSSRVKADAEAASASGREGNAGTRALDPARLKVYLTRQGAEPVAADLSALRDALAAEPGRLEALNSAGRVRLVLGKGSPAGSLTAAEIEEVRRVLSSYGITAKVEVENIPIDWSAKPAGAVETGKDGPEAALLVRQPSAAIAAEGWRRVAALLALPLREAAFLARTLAASLTRPTWGEVAGGVVSKALPFVMGILWWTKAFLPLHPAAFAAAVGLSLALNVFHGVWIDSWANFQNNIGRQRGVNYQTFFNLLYGQVTGGLFRVISWTAIPGTIPPWSPAYWRDIGIATVGGSFFGTLGYQGVNSLYVKGRVPRWGRSMIQQVRDLFFCLGGTFFGTGSMAAFWAVFAVQQSFDLALYAAGRRAARRPILYIAPEAVAASPEFQSSYPVRPGAGEQSPLKQALGALLGNPILKPVVYLARKLRGLLGSPRGGRG